MKYSTIFERSKMNARQLEIQNEIDRLRKLLNAVPKSNKKERLKIASRIHKYEHSK